MILVRPQSITDNDVSTLVNISLSLKEQYVDSAEDPWAGSPFAWILSRPSRQRGKIGEQLIKGWCASRDLNVSRSPDSDADCIIEGSRVEVKFSTLWQSGVYKFQQIRDQNYEYLICLGISPFDAHAWVFRKRDIPFSELPHQHGGSRGRDTWWLSFRPGNPPTWMGNQRGKLSEVYRVLSQLG